MTTSRFIIKTFIILVLIGCQGKSTSNSGETFSKSETSNGEDSYSDDTYCAEVKYHNPNTGTPVSYTHLDVYKRQKMVTMLSLKPKPAKQKMLR